MPVSSTDELTIDGAQKKDRARKIGEFKPTNSPLPEADLEQRRDDPDFDKDKGWVPRNTENIGDLMPLPDEDPVKP